MQKDIPNKELVRIAVEKYLWNKENDNVWQREHSPSYYISKGYLDALLTVFCLDMTEDNDKIVVFTAVRKKEWVTLYKKDYRNLGNE